MSCWTWRAILLSTMGALLAAGCAAPERLTVEQQRLNVESFDTVWQTINDKHYDPSFGGLDWAAVRDELRPQVEQATTMQQARAAMTAAIQRLHLSHFAILPQEAYAELAPSRGEKDNGTTGLTVRIYDETALVTHVRPGSPAEECGVRAGWEIVRIDDWEVAPALAKVEAAQVSGGVRPVQLMRAVMSHLSGPVGEPVRVVFRDGTGWSTTVSIPRAEPEGKLVTFGNLPPIHMEFESRRLEPNVGYIAFNVFFAPDVLMPQFEEAVTSSMDADGIILDLRGNPGGLGAMAMGMAGWFVDQERQQLGTMKARQMTMNFTVYPRGKTFGGPLAILIDGCTGSTSEILAGGLQDLGRAKVFGERSAGAALPSAIERLPNHDGFQYALADYVSASGRRLEGAGVVPDVEAVPTRAALLAGHDPVLETAIHWIYSQKR